MKFCSKSLINLSAGCIVFTCAWQSYFIAASADLAPAKIEGRYIGTWATTKTKELHGTANCIVKQISDQHWEGHFSGTWEHVNFDYTVEFCGDPVAGTATIDGTEYQWTGQLTQDTFKIQFSGSRYEGSIDLKRVDGPATVVSTDKPISKT